MKATSGTKKLLFSAMIFCLGSISGISQAAYLDLTAAGSEGTINDAFFTTNNLQSTGSGVIESFVRVSTNGSIVEGYNTTVNNILDTGSPDTFNHAITLGTVPLLTIDDVVYREFGLDINQTSQDSLLSLDEIQLFVGGTANSNVTTFTAGILDHDGILVYRLDAGSDNYIRLDYNLNPGSGGGDMYFYVPNDLFEGYGADAAVTLYSRFGEIDLYGNNDGFEEWFVRCEEGAVACTPTNVPVPATLALLGLGALGLGFSRRRKQA